MKYFLLPALAQVDAATDQFDNHGLHNIKHQDDYAKKEDQHQGTKGSTWVLWRHGAIQKFPNVAAHTGTQAEVSSVSEGLAHAVRKLDEKEVIQVDVRAAFPGGGNTGLLYYDTRGEDRWLGQTILQQSGNNPKVPDAAPAGFNERSMQIAFTTLATVKNEGTHNYATHWHGTGWNNHPDCRVVAIFHTTFKEQGWASHNKKWAENNGVNTAAGLVLNTANSGGGLDWNDREIDLCYASQNANDFLSNTDHSYKGGYYGKGDKVGRVYGEGHGLSGGAIAGIVLGSIALVVLVIVLVCCFCCKGDSGASSI